MCPDGVEFPTWQIGQPDVENDDCTTGRGQRVAFQPTFGLQPASVFVGKEELDRTDRV